MPESFSRTFQLPPNLLADGGSATVEVSLATAVDVVQAITTNGAFPSRPEGKIKMDSVSVQAESGKDIAFKADQGVVSFKASAGGRAAIGVYDSPGDALSVINLNAPEGLNLDIPDDDNTRHLLLLWGYQVQGSFSGSHPIGMLGAATFGVEGQREAAYAVLHSFPSTAGANDVLRSTVGSWKLPRHVESSQDLAPGTWLLTEVDGSLAVRVNAQLGYNFNFVREAKALGLTGDIGLKLEAGANVALGFEASGKYLVVLGRESLDPAFEQIRLRLFKLSKKGWNFGLNLSATATGVADILPDQVDDLVKAIFGVHGQQIVKDLQLIDEWTDPTKDLSETVARLANQTGLDLLKRTTGIDPKQKFNQAKGIFVNALKQWDELPDKVSSVLWSALPGLPPGSRQLKAFQAFLQAAAATDAEQRRRALATAFQDVGFPNTAAGELVQAAASRGLLALLERSEEFQTISRTTLSILDGGVIRELQGFINERLDLDQVRKVLSKADFDKLDEWLVSKLSDFLDEELGFENLDKIKDTINMVIRKRQEIYEKARQALTRTYDFNLAYTFQKTTTRTALLDINFDLSKPGASTLLKQVLAKSNFDTLLVNPVDGVVLNSAVLTHEISRQGTVQVNMPYFSFRSESINQSLAKVEVEEDGGRVLVYQVDASDAVTIENKMRSQLTVSAAFPVAVGKTIRQRSTDAMTWSYQYLQAKENMQRAELEHQIRPYILNYLPDHFSSGGTSSLDTWMTDLDRAVEDAVHNGTNEFGDTLLSLEVSVPARTLAAWFGPRTKEEVQIDAMEISRRLQRKLKELISFYYFQDLDNVRQDFAAAALLVYASIPASTSISLKNGKLTLNTDKDVYWNWPMPEERRAMMSNPLTRDQLTRHLVQAHDRLLAAGRDQDASFFREAETGDFLSIAGKSEGEKNLKSLLFCEAEIVNGAAEALRHIADFLRNSGNKPQEAIKHLAEFGAEVTTTFNNRVRSIYGGHAIRPLGSMIFLEASCALDPALRNATPNAMLSLTVLKEQRTFKLEAFLKNQWPAREDIALEQRLVSRGLLT
jgi:hypothetical protein